MPKKIDKTCFVIAPIGKEGSESRKWSDQVMTLIIQPAGQECGYKVERADDIQESGAITSQVIQRCANADLVIANLTDHNPNVFYELGLRHAIGKPVIQLIQKGQSIPFDVGAIRTIFYDKETPTSFLECRKELVEFMKNIDFEKPVLGNPITSSFIETSSKGMLQGKEFVSSKAHSQDESDIQGYDVALSFAGEQRDYVEKVAKELNLFGIRVFYDKFHPSKMWGKNLVEFLQHVYEHDCKYCVIFVSKEYEKKFYTTHEKRSAISDKVKVLEDRILQVKFDKINLPGIPTANQYLKAQNYEPIEIARLIKDKIGLNTSQTISSENHNQMDIDSLQSAITKLKEKGLEAAIIHFDRAITLLRENHGEDALLRLKRGLRFVLNESIVRKGHARPMSNLQMYEQIRMLFPKIYHHVRVFWEIVLSLEHQESFLNINDISYAIRGIDLLLESLD